MIVIFMSTQKNIPTIPDFTVTVEHVQARAMIEWRGTRHEFWKVGVGSDGPFHPRVELTMAQAKAVFFLLSEFNRMTEDS